MEAGNSEHAGAAQKRVVDGAAGNENIPICKQGSNLNFGTVDVSVSRLA